VVSAARRLQTLLIVRPTRRLVLRLGAVWPLLVFTGAAFAGPRQAPSFSLESTAGARRSLVDYRGRVVLLMYEDRDSQEQNAALKAEVRRRIREESLGRNLVVVPVADVRRYDYWPARSVVRAAVADQAKALGAEILLDWEGDIARRYGFRTPGSNVALIGRVGELLYQGTGALAADERGRFHHLLSGALVPSSRAKVARSGGTAR
jgi:hypothetical protein